MQTQFGMDFTIDASKLDAFVRKQLTEQLQLRLNQMKRNLLFEAKVMVAGAIESSPEWRSLQEVGSGSNVTLREHFGLADPGPVLKRIVKAVQDGIVVDIGAPAGSSLGSIVVRILPGDYTAVLAVEGAEYTSQGRFRRGRLNPRKIFHPNESHPYTYVIPWLRWLLLEGPGLILVDAEINTKAGSRAASRTGRAIMVHPTQRPSEGWHVPAEFAGTAEDNWLTRALRDAQVGDRIIEMIQKAVSL